MTKAVLFVEDGTVGSVGKSEHNRSERLAIRSSNETSASRVYLFDGHTCRLFQQGKEIKSEDLGGFQQPSGFAKWFVKKLPQNTEALIYIADLKFAEYGDENSQNVKPITKTYGAELFSTLSLEFTGNLSTIVYSRWVGGNIQTLQQHFKTVHTYERLTTTHDEIISIIEDLL